MLLKELTTTSSQPWEHDWAQASNALRETHIKDTRGSVAPTWSVSPSYRTYESTLGKGTATPQQPLRYQLFVPSWLDSPTAYQTPVELQPPVELQLTFLREAAQVGNSTAFIERVKGMEWNRYPPDALSEAIDLAIELDQAKTAYTLARTGIQFFPHNERFKTAERVLSPPVVRVGKQASAKGLRETYTWLREHAKDYVGSWVAVREGRLLGSAPSLNELLARIGPIEDPPSTVTVRVS